MNSYRRWGKRVGDAVAASVALVVLAPVTAGIGVAVRRRLGSPVLYRATRPGREGTPFTLLKFRTMSEAHDANGRPLDDAERVTPLGSTLRSWSLDELPSLWNVVRGDVSLVGPRPLLMEYLDRYTPDQARRHEVRPGLSGWAQVNGRNALSWEEKFALDVWYVDHVSLALDLKIVLRTLLAVVTRQGISASGHATAPPFRGSADADSSLT